MRRFLSTRSALRDNRRALYVAASAGRAACAIASLKNSSCPRYVMKRAGVVKWISVDPQDAAESLEQFGGVLATAAGRVRTRR